MEKDLVIKHVKVVFAELEDKGFGTSITIDVTDPALQEDITAWTKANNVNGGVARFKDYTTKDGVATKQYSIKLSKYTDFQAKEDGMELGYGSVINLVAHPYDYDNKFGKGTSASASAIFILKSKINTTMDKIAE